MTEKCKDHTKLQLYKGFCRKHQKGEEALINQNHHCEDGVLRVRRRDPRHRIPSDVAFSNPPPISPADADCPEGTFPDAWPALPTTGKPAWWRVVFHT